MILLPTFRAACGPRGPFCAADFFHIFVVAVRQKRQQSEFASHSFTLKAAWQKAKALSRNSGQGRDSRSRLKKDF